MINQTSNSQQNGNPTTFQERFGPTEIHTAEQQAQKVADSITTDLLETMRPTLIIGLGGTGQLGILNLKVLLEQRFGDRWQGKIILLAVDTTQEPLAIQVGDRILTLEPGVEFIHIGNVPVGRIIRHIDHHPAIRKRLERALDRIPAIVLRDGARQDRVLGLLSFYWHYARIKHHLEQAIWRLADREAAGADLANQQQGINVTLLCSLTGGTGSGIFLDTAYLLRSLFEELGNQHEFCHLTGVVVLPQAFRGISGGHIRANAAAALEELELVMSAQGGLVAEYPDDRMINMRESLFDLLISLDGVDDRGHTWANLQAVIQMAAEGVFIQAASQVGRQNKNAFDNLQSVLSNVNDEGSPTCLASFGIGSMVFPSPEVADLLAMWQVRDAITSQWLQAVNNQDLAQGNNDSIKSVVTSRLQTVSSGQLLPLLRLDVESERTVQVDLPLPQWLLNRPIDEVPTEAAQHVHAYGRIRVQDEMIGSITRNARAQSQTEAKQWENWINQVAFAPDSSLPQTMAILQAAQNQLILWSESTRRQLAELDQEEARKSDALAQQEASVAAAAGSIPIGRTSRVRKQLVDYFQIAQALYENRLVQSELRGCLFIWGELNKTLNNLANTLQTLINRFETLAERLDKEAAEQGAALQKNGIAQISLAEEPYVQALYTRFAQPQLHLLTLPGITTTPGIQPDAVTPLGLAALSTTELGQHLLRSVSSFFAPVRNKTIEDVLRERAAEKSPAARKRQLQNLATPSWSIDRTRLPNGGANLKKVMVIGVYDAADTCLGQENTFVSTRDPHRIVAYIMVAGAPISALQHIAGYRQELTQAKRNRPMYILPELLAGFDQGPLAFALGTLFGFIHSQGTYFYYQPADPLANQVKIGNGMVKAIQTLNGREELAREILERVEAHIAQLGLQQTIEILTSYYTAVPTENSVLAETTRELKRQVRDYAAELRQIDDLQLLQTISTTS